MGQTRASNGQAMTPLHADPAKSHTLPGWAYTDAELFERERTAIFDRGWHYAGPLSALAKAGDYITAGLLDQNIIVIRGKDGELRGFYNVCQHRAHELLKGRGCAKVITCPYHAWSYHADGRLRSARGTENIDRFPIRRVSSQAGAHRGLRRSLRLLHAG